MDSDTRRMRGVRPYGFTNMKTGEGVEQVARFIEARGGLGAAVA
jgi:urease accessory protein